MEENITMDNRSINDLISKSTEIILQEAHTLDDMKLLSKLRYFLSIAYKNTNTKWSADEWLYNWTRSSETTTRIENGTAVTRAEAEGKAEAEKLYGSYRETNATAAWISKMLETLGWFIIALQVEYKALQETQM